MATDKGLPRIIHDETFALKSTMTDIAVRRDAFCTSRAVQGKLFLCTTEADHARQRQFRAGIVRFQLLNNICIAFFPRSIERTHECDQDVLPSLAVDGERVYTSVCKTGNPIASARPSGYWRMRRTSLPTNLKGAVIRQDVEA